MSFNPPIPPDAEWSSAYSEPLFPPQESLYENGSVGIGTPSTAPSNDGCHDPCAPLQGDYEGSSVPIYDPLAGPLYLPLEPEDPYREYRTNPPAPVLEYVPSIPDAVLHCNLENSQHTERGFDGNGDVLPQEYAPMAPMYGEEPFYGALCMVNPAPAVPPSALPDSSQPCPSSSPRPEMVSPFSARVAQPSQGYSPFMAPQPYQQQQKRYALMQKWQQALFQRRRELLLLRQHQQCSQQPQGWQYQPGQFYVPQELLASPSFLCPSAPPSACLQRISSPSIYHSRCHQQQQEVEEDERRPSSPSAKAKRSKVTRCVVYEDRSSNNQKKILKLRGAGKAGAANPEETETGAEQGPSLEERVAPAKRPRHNSSGEREAKKKRPRISAGAGCTEGPGGGNSDSDRNGEVSPQKETEEGDDALSGTIHSSNLAATPNLKKAGMKAEWTRTQPVKVVFEKRKNTLFKMCDSIDLITGAK